MDTTPAIKALFDQAGFAAVGLARPDPPAHIAVYRDWIGNGHHGEMAYLAEQRALERRADPRLILPGTVISLAAAYPHPASAPDLPGPLRGRVASYAWGHDYHDILPARLNQAATALSKLLGQPIATRTYTDTGPILERDLAQRAGLGWIGKNTCLILPGKGSFFFLAELFLDLELEPDPPFQADRCGTCRRCIDACPSGCIRPDRTLDARRCISYLTIENKGAIPADLRPQIQDWVFGCDICQQVCPWNQRTTIGLGDPALEARPERARPDLAAELALSPQSFNLKFKTSPLKRAKRRGYLRNITVALGNAQDPDAALPLAACLASEPEALVRAHAAWALGRLGTPTAQAGLEKALRSETSPEVTAEIRAALGSN